MKTYSYSYLYMYMYKYILPGAKHEVRFRGSVKEQAVARLMRIVVLKLQ